MERFSPTARSRVKRGKQHARYDRETVYAILDAGLFCHVAFCVDGQPYLTPSSYGREGDEIFLHGAIANRRLTHLAQGVAATISVAMVDGLVFARSQTHHSLNYRSVVLFGHATEVTEPAAKRRALAAILEQMAPGRTAACRPPTQAELDVTKVLAFRIEEASAKLREGEGGDAEEDLTLPYWAGVLPLQLAPSEPRPVGNLRDGLAVPEHVARWQPR